MRAALGRHRDSAKAATRTKTNENVLPTANAMTHLLGCGFSRRQQQHLLPPATAASHVIVITVKTKAVERASHYQHTTHTPRLTAGDPPTERGRCMLALESCLHTRVCMFITSDYFWEGDDEV